MTDSEEKVLAAALTLSCCYKNMAACNNQERALIDACKEYRKGKLLENLISKIDNLRSVRERNSNRGNKELDDAVWSVIALADAVR